MELEALAQHHEQAVETLERRRLDTALDAADRVLTRSGPQRKATLADPLSRPGLAQ
jgi:hypothetical protein